MSIFPDKENTGIHIKNDITDSYWNDINPSCFIAFVVAIQLGGWLVIFFTLLYLYQSMPMPTLARFKSVSFGTVTLYYDPKHTIYNFYASIFC